MNQCCFICNNRANLSLRNASSLFGEQNSLQSGKKVSEVVSEIVGKPVVENKVHTSVLCKKCFKTCSEYDSIQVRLQTIKTELLEQFKQSLPNHNLDYENYEKKVCSPPKPKPMLGNKLVLPASKLQPIPPDLLLKVGKLASFSKSNVIFPQIKPITASTLNLKVTVGSSVLTQTIKTSTSKPIEKPLDSNSILTSLTDALKDDLDSLVTSQSNMNSMSPKNSILSFNVNSLPKDFLSGAILRKLDENNDEYEKGDETNEDHRMEIDDDCLSVVPVSSANGNMVLQVDGLQSKSDPTPEVSEYLNLPSLDGADEVSDAHKYILGKLEILNEGDEDDDDDDDDDEGHTIVLDSENGSILRMVTGQKFIYEGGEISLVMPDDQQDGDGDQHDNGDSQDSNDESQIELQVSGDEETANAIIAAAQEKGGAFIKVESGEMYRVKSVSSATADRADAPLHIVAQDGDLFKCLLCEKNDENTPLEDADTMMRHLKSQHDARIYLCRFCGAVMRKRTEYATHIAGHASAPSGGTGGGSRGSHRCGVCGKSYSSRTLLLEHANLHSGARPYVCTHCGKAFASKYTHQAHLKTHAVTIYVHKSYSSRTLLLEHANLRSGTRPYVCTHCGKAFASKYTHQAHLKTHAVTILLHKSYSSRTLLLEHANLHSGARPYVCTHCGKAFASKNTHQAHLKTHAVTIHLHKSFSSRTLLLKHANRHSGARPYVCTHCGKAFASKNTHQAHLKTHAVTIHLHKSYSSRTLLLEHANLHSGARPYVCTHCGKAFASKNTHQAHLKTHAVTIHLHKSFSSRTLLLKHANRHSGARPYVCTHCGKAFASKNTHQAHLKTHAVTIHLHKSYSSRTLLLKHANRHSGARPYVCTHCGKAFASKNTHQAHLKTHAVTIHLHKSYSSRTLLLKHATLHSGTRPCVCTHRGKAFASKNTHQAHLKTHAVRPRPFKCTQCGKSFLTQQNLNQHEKTHSGVKDFVCNICNKAFSTQHNLEVHGVVHSGNKAFVCSVCGKAFARRAELRDHMRIHTGERPFSCDLCGARFTQRSNLHSHRRATHFDDKRYHCELCPKRFKRRRLLEYHIKSSHTGERPLKCGICHLSFVYPEHYKKHVRIHSGERPYTCEICGKSFNSRDNRNTHRFVHSDKKPYECVACGAGYMRKQLLYAHMNTSGHLNGSIVVNQPRVIKVTEGTNQPTEITNVEAKNTKFDTIFEDNELEASVKSVVKAETEVKLEDAKFYITDDKKLILQGSDKTTLNLLQEGDEPTLLTIHNIGERAGGTTILEAVDADQLGDQTEIVANDENGGVVRLIQIKLPNGNNGWVAIN